MRQISSFSLLVLVILSLCLTRQSYSFTVSTSMQRNVLTKKYGFFMVENEAEDAIEEKPQVACPDCDMCDGSGRILGGIPTILPWWPIKPYRPCPRFIERGGQYSRIGQPLDEIAFGRGETNLKDEDDDF